MQPGFPATEARTHDVRATRRGVRLRGRVGRITVLGSLLVGSGLAPPADAGAPDDLPPPRLKLALALEALPPRGAQPPAARDPASRASEIPRLRLETALAPPTSPWAPRGGPTGLAPTPTQPSPAPQRDDRTRNEPVLQRPRPEQGEPPPDVPPLTGPLRKGSASAKAPSAPTMPVAPVSAADRSGSDAAVYGEGDFLPADELEDDAVPSGPRPAPGAAAPAPSASSPRRKWGAAPIRWGGTVSAGLRRYQTEDGTANLQQVYETRMRASSFVIQPYIALVTGEMGLTMVRSQNDGGSSVAASNLVGTSVSGSGTASVFPQSRFPFQASLSVSDSRSDGSITDTNTQRRRLTLRQDYSPLVGQWRTSGQYDRSELKGDFGTDTVDRLSGMYSTSLEGHSLSGSGSLSSNRASGGRSSDLYLSGSHGYRLSDAWVLDSNATYTSQDFDFSGEGTSFGGKATSAQLYSFANWTPQDSRWRGTAYGRYFQTESSFGGVSFKSQNYAGSGSLSYQASRNLSLYGTLGVTSSGSGRFGTTQSLGLGYSGDPRTWGPYSYNWNASSSVNNSTSSSGTSTRSGSVALGHSLTRNWQLSETTLVNGSVNQTAGTTRSQGIGSVTNSTLTHSASLSLQASPTDELSGLISASVSDSRVSGDATSAFQFFNLQVSGRWRINAYSDMSSNLTWQVSKQSNRQNDEIAQEFTIDPETGELRERQDIFLDESRSRTSSLSGNFNYGHVRVFGVRGLRYTLDFRANTNRTYARRFGDPDADRESPSLDLDQRLKYRIGRLDTELQVRVAEFEERRNSLVFLRVTREFGAF